MKISIKIHYYPFMSVAKTDILSFIPDNGKLMSFFSIGLAKRLWILPIFSKNKLLFSLAFLCCLSLISLISSLYFLLSGNFGFKSFFFLFSWRWNIIH